MKWVFALMLCTLGFATECHWACDDPVWKSNCEARCLPPVCEFQYPCEELKPEAWIVCLEPEDADVLVTESCPLCETHVEDIPEECLPNSIVCEAPQCGWECHLNPFAIQPRCEIQCELPACAFSGAAKFRLF